MIMCDMIFFFPGLKFSNSGSAFASCSEQGFSHQCVERVKCKARSGSSFSRLITEGRNICRSTHLFKCGFQSVG